MVVDEGLVLTDWGTPSSKNDGSLCERGEAQKGGREMKGGRERRKVTCTLLLVTLIVCCAIPLTGMMLPWLSTASTLTSTFLSARLLPFSN